METRPYGLLVRCDATLVDAETRLRDALQAEGFGIISEIDIAAILSEKIGLQRPPYKVLGACNPGLAARALEAEADMGVLLPCNVAIYTDGDTTVVEAIDPDTMARLSSHPDVVGIAAEARERIGRALATFEATSG
jgi:uncharacterized protein (DUF302 family)